MAGWLLTIVRCLVCCAMLLLVFFGIIVFFADYPGYKRSRAFWESISIIVGVGVVALGLASMDRRGEQGKMWQGVMIVCSMAIALILLYRW